MTKRASFSLPELPPLTPDEIQQFSLSLRELAFAGRPFPSHRLDWNRALTWKRALDVLPASLDLLGAT